MNEFGVVETVNRLSESIVIRVTDAADRWLDPSFDQTLGVSNGQILLAAIRVMNHSAFLDGPSLVQGLLKGIENKVSFGRSRYPPSHDAISECIDDKSHIDKALLCRHLGKIADPK